MVLSALASSNSLPTITHFRCDPNKFWFSEGKESNVELLSNAIRAMKNLTYLNLFDSRFSTEAADKVFSAIVANAEQNPDLVDINLFEAGGYDNKKFSSSAKEHIAALTAKGLTIAQTEEQREEMNMRYHGNKHGE